MYAFSYGNVKVSRKSRKERGAEKKKAEFFSDLNCGIIFFCNRLSIALIGAEKVCAPAELRATIWWGYRSRSASNFPLRWALICCNSIR